MGDVSHHLLFGRVENRGRAEIGPDAAGQFFSFADIQNFALGVFKDIDAGLLREGGKLGFKSHAASIAWTRLSLKGFSGILPVYGE